MADEHSGSPSGCLQSAEISSLDDNFEIMEDLLCEDEVFNELEDEFSNDVSMICVFYSSFFFVKFG